MKHKELDVPKTLRNSVRGFWYRSMNFGTEEAAFEVLPDGHAEIVFHFGNGCSLRHNDRIEPMPSPFIVGLLGQPVYFQSTGNLQVIGIKCLPWAVYDLLDLTVVKCGVTSLSHPIAALQNSLQKILQEGNADLALTLVRDWFISEKSGTLPIETLNKAGKAMLGGKGSLPVTSVAAAANTTVRTLERQFKASSGHTVKDVSGLIRFEQARDRLWEQPDISVSALASELGYADQSHLNREFKRYAGMTAGAFAKQATARKNTLAGDFVAIVLSS